MLGGEVVVVLRVVVLAQRDAAALRVGDLAVLDDPTLGPVGADHAVLEGSGRRPGGGGLLHLEAGEGDVALAGFIREEAAAAHVDLRQGCVGIDILEVRVDDGLVAVLLRDPLVHGVLRLPGGRVHFARDAFLHRQGFVHGAAVEVDAARMADSGCEVPVAVDLDHIGIEAAENAVVHADHPQAVLLLHPAGNGLRAGDDCTQGFHGAVGDALILGAAVAGADLLAVHAGVDEHLIAGLGEVCRVADAAEGALGRAIAFMRGLGVDIINHGRTSLFKWNEIADFIIP